MTTHICRTCKQEKELNTQNFSKSSKNPSGFKRVCKICRKKSEFSYYRTIEGVITTIYKGQIKSSKKRGHPAPEYSKQELHSAIIKKDLFLKLFSTWVSSGYKTNLKPSIDRIDDYLPYTKDNIQLMTWEGNKNKYDLQRKAGISNKQSKRVKQFTLEGIFINEYYSANEARRQTGVPNGNISLNCLGKNKTAGGFKWEYA